MNTKYRNTVTIKDIEPQALWELNEQLGQFILIDDDQFVAVDFEQHLHQFELAEIKQTCLNCNSADIDFDAQIGYQCFDCNHVWH